MPTTLPGVEPEQAAFQLYWQDHAMSQFGEVESVFGKVGRADTGTDPAPYSMAETVIRLRPRAEWPRVARRALVLAVGAGPASEGLGCSGPTRPRAPAPSWWPRWTTPSGCRVDRRLDGARRARMDMMATGVRTPVGIRIVSPEPARLDALGTAVRARVAALAGTRSAVFESLGGETWLGFRG